MSVVLAAGHEIAGRFVLWNERYMVEFSLSQRTREEGRWAEVARIDTEHNKIHKHQFVRASQDQRGAVTDISDIPPNEPWSVIDAGYANALLIMENEWQENLRRWRSDGR